MTETLSIPGNTFTIIEDGEATAGRIGVVECELEPGWLGPPQHTHKQHDETFYVLKGAVRFATGERSFVLREGESTTIPLGTPHTFGNASDDDRAATARHRLPRSLHQVLPRAVVTSDERRGSSRPHDGEGSDGRLRHRAIPCDFVKGTLVDHRGQRCGSVAEHRSARTAHRHAARPAGADGVGVPGPGPLKRATRRTLDADDDRGDGLRGARRGVRAEAGAAPLPRRRWPSARTTCACTLVEDYDGDAAQGLGGRDDGRRAVRALRALPGYGEEKAKIFVAILAKRMDVKPEGWEQVAGPFADPTPRSVADIDTPEPRSRRCASGRRR